MQGETGTWATASPWLVGSGWLACFGLFLLSTAGCSRADILDYRDEPDGAPHADGSVLPDGAVPGEGGPTPTGCNANSCPSGCCDRSGTCQSGTALSACGSAGEACADCQAAGYQLCNTTLHACGDTVGPQCDGTNCSGCCFSTQCLAGTDPTACGRRGQACSNCVATGEGCVPGGQSGGSCQMQASCDPQSCASGCCDGRGRCRSGTSDRACGGGGGQCQDCTQSGETCGNQQCTMPPPPPVCDAQSCPSGCCDNGGNCRPGTSDRRCGTGGASCANCASSGETCNNQQCTVPPSACAMSCVGCCDPAGGCHGGFLDTQCGGYGATCQDCTHLSPPSTCDLQVSPTTCTGPQAACPGPYPGCMSGPPPVPAKQNVCPANDLQNAAAACAMGLWTSPQCGTFLSYENMQNPNCYQCLLPFMSDFDQVAGLAACAAPYLDPTCSQQAFCDGDCLTTTCAACASATGLSTCVMQVTASTCSSYANGNTCLQTALAGPAKVCSPSTYQGSYGAWLAAVGAMYCGM